MGKAEFKIGKGLLQNWERLTAKLGKADYKIGKGLLQNWEMLLSIKLGKAEWIDLAQAKADDMLSAFG